MPTNHDIIVRSHPGGRAWPAAAQRSAPVGRKIVHVSASERSGGAARAAYRLHHTLREREVDSRMFVLEKETGEPDTIQYRPTPAALPRIQRILRKHFLYREQARYHPTRPAGCEHFRDDRSPFGGDLLRQLPDSGLLNLHWISDFIDYRKFFSFAGSRRPIVWTLHDMNPFTGGCHYDLGCGKFRNECGACPQLGSTDPADLSHAIHRRKADALAHLSPEKIRIVAGSRWMAREAANSSLFSRFDIRIVHCGIDPKTFRPRDGASLRAALEIPPESFVVLFAADHLSNRRKGFSLLLEALQTLPPDTPLHLLSAGNAEEGFETPFPHIHLGHMSSDTLLSLFYSAGDCFIIPSVQEAFGLTALEAMACGTPVIGFAAGGIPDMIIDGQNGLLAPVGDVAELARKIRWMIDHRDALPRMGEAARRITVERFSLQQQATLYSKIYDELEDLFPSPASG